jgi:hypothetical protein
MLVWLLIRLKTINKLIINKLTVNKIEKQNQI